MNYKYKKKKKGSMSIEVIIFALTAIILICGFIDLIGIIRKTTALSSTANYVSRTVAAQGGVQQKTVKNFVGGDNLYTNSNTLYNNVKASMDVVGILDWTLTINGYQLAADSNIPLIDYGNTITITLTAKYAWSLTSAVLPGTNDMTKTVTRKPISGFKIRTGIGKIDYGK